MVERNDALSVLHAPMAIVFILYGCAGPAGPLREIVFGVGAGMTAFGVAYVIVHDGLVHARLPVGFLLRVPLVRGPLREVVRAHRQHHAAAPGGPPYGLFFGPRELRKAQAVTPSSSREPALSGSTTPAPRPTGRPPTGPAPS